MFVRIIVALITVPWLLGGLGDVNYGVFILAFGLLTSFSFLELGAGKTILRFTSEYRADKDLVKFKSAFDVGTSLIIYAAILLFLILTIVSFLNQHLFEINGLSFTESFTVFFTAAIFGVIVFIEIITSNLLYAYEKFLERNILLFIKTLLLIVISFLVYKDIIGLIQYSFLYLIIEILLFIGDIILIMKIKNFPNLNINILKISSLRKSAEFKYSTDIFLISMISTLSQNTDKFVISLFLDIKFVAIYTIVTKPFFIFKSLTGSLFSALQPILIRQHKNDKIIFRKTVVSFIQIPIIIFIPIVLYCIFFLDNFLALWLDKNYIYSQYVIWGQIALFALIPRLLISIPNRVLLLTGITKPVKKAEYYFTILNIILSLLITYIYNTIGGVIIGTLVQFSLGSFYFLRLLNVYFKVTINQIFTKFMTTFIMASIIFFVLFKIIFVANELSKDSLILIIIGSLFLIILSEYLVLKKLDLLKYIF